jgi:hypothetical protein
MVDLVSAIFVGNLLVTGFLVGVIWFVQIVHYPLFVQIEAASFPRYHARHSDLTTRVVALPMLLELILSGLLPFARLPGVDVPIAWLGFALALAVWLCTFLIAVPLHTRLGRGHDRAIIARLVATNWLRTIAWTAHLLLLIVLLLRIMAAGN